MKENCLMMAKKMGKEEVEKLVNRQAHKLPLFVGRIAYLKKTGKIAL